MKSKIVVSVLLVSQIMFASSAFAQSGDADKQAALQQDVQALQTEAARYRDRGNGEIFGAGAGTAVFGIIHAMTNMPRPAYRTFYTLAALLATKGLVDQQVGDHYQRASVNLSISKTLPPDTQGQQVSQVNKVGATQ